ncbi:hypothetical protein CHS0354_039780 [Potamilus streckersoni]|uniref:Non-homologous end-joining factor 1 n=1 Tax=Potamilus streckersoni TaxID=2493646 RepID=A0AAE0VM68_9BIVA|nr:hypothetical protein CHS0354_039780 [Potamilus streckersoni]
MSSEVEWRRQWKPDLSACHWQPLKIEGKVFLVKWRFTQNSYEILITDFSLFWYEEMSEDSLNKRVQKLNPSIEASVTRILDQIQGALERTGKDTTLNISLEPGRSGNNAEKLTLTINSQLAGMPFIWKFFCKPGETKMCSDHLIIPLLTMVAELKRRQQELFKLLQNKDREIEEYKAQGVKTSRKHIQTNPFVETAFEMNMMTSKDFEHEIKNYRTTAFDSDGQDLYRQIMTKKAWVERAPTKDEETDSLSQDGSLEGTKKESSTPSWGTSRLPPSITGSKSPNKSQSKTSSPSKSPISTTSDTPESSPVKDSEQLRRQALQRRLENEEMKKQEKAKKKKKIAF